MGSKFKISKSDAGELAERNSSLIPTTPLRKEDWSDKTAASWSEHTGFLERTQITGVRPPPRLENKGLSPVVAAQMAVAASSGAGSSAVSVGKILGLLILLPILGASVYYGASGEAPATNLPEPPAPKIAKNPKATSVSPAAKSPTKVELPDAKLTRLQSNLHPLIRFSSQPVGAQQNGSTTRDSAIITLDAAEISRLRELANRDGQLKNLIQNWKAQSQLSHNATPLAIATFTETDPTDSNVAAARVELQQLRDLIMTALVTGDAEMVKRLRNIVLVWSKTYVPLGDANSDNELEPVIEAYAFLRSTLPADQRKAIDEWLLNIADREISELFDHPKTNDLYFAQHLKTMALIGFATDNANIQGYVVANLPVHVTSSIESNGSTTTYQTTQSIRKHAEHVQALLRVSVLFDRARISPVDSLPKIGTRLAKAIDFAYPYLIGKMEHDEFRGAKSAVESEHKLNPRRALGFLDTALYFRSSLVSDIAHLLNQPNNFAWDSQSLYFNSMARKTDDFESRMLSPTTFRLPSSTVNVKDSGTK